MENNNERKWGQGIMIFWCKTIDMKVDQKKSEKLFPKTKKLFKEYWSEDIAKVNLIQNQDYSVGLSGRD